MVSFIDMLYLKQKRILMGVIYVVLIPSFVHLFIGLLILFIHSFILIILFHWYKQLFVVLSKLHQSLLSTLGPAKGILIIAEFGRRKKNTHLHLLLFWWRCVDTWSFWRGLLYPLAEAVVALRYNTVYPPRGMDNTISWRFPLSPVLGISYPPAVSRVGKASNFLVHMLAVTSFEKEYAFLFEPGQNHRYLLKSWRGSGCFFFQTHKCFCLCIRNRYAYAIPCRCCHYMTLRCRLFSVPRAGAAARSTVVRWSVTKQSSVFFSHWNHRGHRWWNLGAIFKAACFFVTHVLRNVKEIQG